MSKKKACGGTWSAMGNMLLPTYAARYAEPYALESVPTLSTPPKFSTNMKDELKIWLRFSSLGSVVDFDRIKIP